LVGSLATAKLLTNQKAPFFPALTVHLQVRARLKRRARARKRKERETRNKALKKSFQAERLYSFSL